jgi:hypothetical protein
MHSIPPRVDRHLRTIYDEEQSGQIQLQTGDNYWLSDVAVDGVVNFDAGTWKLKLATPNLADLTVKVGGWNATNDSFYQFTLTSSQEEDNGLLIIQTAMGTILTGDYLAVQVINSGEA